MIVYVKFLRFCFDAKEIDKLFATYRSYCKIEFTYWKIAPCYTNFILILVDKLSK